MVVILDANLPGLGAEHILSRASDDVSLTRHAYVVVTGTGPHHLSPSLRGLLSQLNAAVLQMPFTVETLLDVLGQAARAAPAEATSGPTNGSSARTRS